ncbi:MAG: hypothetical protein O2954_14070 [bacterium]|nr:hypothetical protein [bacterium]
MVTSRQRMLDAFSFHHPDRMPVVYHPSPAGLHVHGKKLLDLFNAYPPDNAIVFDEIPGPPEGAVDEEGRYYELRADDWGTTWKFLIFGVHGHPKRYPFASWAEAGAFPAAPKVGSETFQIEKREVEAQKKEFLTFQGWVSIFEKVHALRPFEELLMDLGTEDPELMAFLDRLEAYWAQVVDYHLALGVDVVTFGDDWGTQTGQMISTDLFRRVFKLRYRRLMDRVRAAGRKVFFHSCGYLGEIFDELVDLGIDGFWPQITRYDPAVFPQRCKECGIAIYIHPDRQRLIPLGTPTEIDRAIREYADVYHKLGGGGIFYIEIENDAPFENVEALIESVDRYR